MGLYEYFTTFVRKESRANTQRMVERRYGLIHKQYRFNVERVLGPEPPGFKERFGQEYRVFKIRRKK